MSDEAVKVQYEGVCTEISEKNGWTSFAIDVGRQYPVKLSTKLPALIEQARAAGQQRAVWSAKESQGGENPNKPGTFYTNRYLDGVEVGGTITQQAAAAQASSSQPTPSQAMPDNVKQHVIVRQACLKAAATINAAELMRIGPSAPPAVDIAADTIALAHRFETWVYRDVDEVPF